MINVNGTTITMTRGDTLIVQVGIQNGTEPYVPVEGDAVRFALKSGLNSKGTEFKESTPLILKDIPTDTLILRLESNDTKALPFGDYTYDIEITYADGTVDTFITEGKLTLAPEVH